MSGEKSTTDFDALERAFELDLFPSGSRHHPRRYNPRDLAVTPTHIVWFDLEKGTEHIQTMGDYAEEKSRADQELFGRTRTVNFMPGSLVGLPTPDWVYEI